MGERLKRVLWNAGVRDVDRFVDLVREHRGMLEDLDTEWEAQLRAALIGPHQELYDESADFRAVIDVMVPSLVYQMGRLAAGAEAMLERGDTRH